MTSHAPKILMAALLLAVADVQAAEPAPPPAATSSASTDAPWLIAVGPRLGLNLPTSKLHAFIVAGLSVDVALPVLEHRLSVALDLTFTRPGFDGAGSDPRVGGGYTMRIEEREVKIGLDAVYRFLDGPLQPRAGLGPVLQLLHSTETTSFGTGSNSESDGRLGFELFGGADYKLGPGFATGELRVVYAGLAHQLTGDVNSGNVTLSVGYRLTF